MDRVIRVRVLDKNGRSIPDATVSVLVNGDYIGKAKSASTNAGTVYTLQFNDAESEVALRAEYEGEESQEVALAKEVNKWDFTFSNVEVAVPRDKPFWEEHLPGILGVIFLVTCIVLAIVFREPSVFQKRVFVGALAIGLAGLGAEIPGFLNVDMKLGTKLSITAAGALAIFVLVYFFGPG
jgi:hypothetical protein